MDGSKRFLIVSADDFGIGNPTSDGVLEAAATGTITASVLLANSPYAEYAVRSWRQRGSPMELGWHPNLTLDRPVLSPVQVPSLVGPDGQFWKLSAFLRNWLLGRLREEEIELELGAQFRRYCELTGQKPAIVNTHQHVGVFSPVGAILIYVLEQHGCYPFVRRVRESLSTLIRVPGARFKRTMLTLLGRKRGQGKFAGMVQGMHHTTCPRRLFPPANDWLIGITDPKWVKQPNFFQQWLASVPGRCVELMCHPGHWDDSLLNRDCNAGDGLQQRRVDELRMLRQPAFLEAVRAAGFTLISPSELNRSGNSVTAWPKKIDSHVTGTALSDAKGTQSVSALTFD